MQELTTRVPIPFDVESDALKALTVLHLLDNVLPVLRRDLVALVPPRFDFALPDDVFFGEAAAEVLDLEIERCERSVFQGSADVHEFSMEPQAGSGVVHDARIPRYFPRYFDILQDGMVTFSIDSASSDGVGVLASVYGKIQMERKAEAWDAAFHVTRHPVRRRGVARGLDV